MVTFVARCVKVNGFNRKITTRGNDITTDLVLVVSARTIGHHARGVIVIIWIRAGDGDIVGVVVVDGKVIGQMFQRICKCMELDETYST